MKLRIAVAAAMIICGMVLIMCGCAKDVATDAGMYDEPAGEAGGSRADQQLQIEIANVLPQVTKNHSE